MNDPYSIYDSYIIFTKKFNDGNTYNLNNYGVIFHVNVVVNDYKQQMKNYYRLPNNLITLIKRCLHDNKYNVRQLISICKKTAKYYYKQCYYKQFYQKIKLINN